MTLIPKTAQDDSVYDSVKSLKQIKNIIQSGQTANLQGHLVVSDVFGTAIYYEQRVPKIETSRFSKFSKSS